MSSVNRKHVESDEGLPGEDSFLDIVANIVGILIILVMVVGARASHSSRSNSQRGDAVSVLPDSQHAPQESQTDKASAASSSETPDVAEIRHAIAAGNRENGDLIRRTVFLQGEMSRIEQERVELITLKKIAEEALAKRREELEQESQEEFDVQRSMMTLQLSLQELTEEKISLIGQINDTEEEVCIPTPIAQRVSGKPITIRLKRGRLAVIPVEALLSEFDKDRRKALNSGARNRGAASDLAGPIDGFRMRVYRQTITDRAVEVAPMFARTRVKEELAMKILPTSEELGVPIAQALLPDSHYMRLVKAGMREKRQVVAFVYPDAYSDYQAVRKAMWELEPTPVQVAPALMKREDTPIVFSPSGYEPRAQ